MVTYGVLMGLALLVLVSGVAVALAIRANRGVRQFREEHHEAFGGRHAP